MRITKFLADFDLETSGERVRVLGKRLCQLGEGS